MNNNEETMILGFIALFLVALFLVFFTNTLGMTSLTVARDLYLDALVWVVILFLAIVGLVRGK